MSLNLRWAHSLSQHSDFSIERAWAKCPDAWPMETVRWYMGIVLSSYIGGDWLQSNRNLTQVSKKLVYTLDYIKQFVISRTAIGKNKSGSHIRYVPFYFNHFLCHLCVVMLTLPISVTPGWSHPAWVCTFVKECFLYPEIYIMAFYQGCDL